LFVINIFASQTAFILPIIDNLIKESYKLIEESDFYEPLALILCPTRENAIHVSDVAYSFSRGTIIQNICINSNKPIRKKVEVR